jgi:trehalose 6-phosphate synthase
MKQRVLVASNRGPVSYAYGADGALAGRRGGGGMIGGVMSGLAAVAPGTEATWICAALSDADRAVARQQMDGARDGASASPGPEDSDGVPVRMLDIPVDTFDRAYNNVANSALWFVHHMLFDTPNQPRFGLEFARDWAAYRAVNETFADALAQEACHGQAPAGGLRVLVQDYHLSLVPRLLREQLGEAAAGTRIGYFCHTPWAPPDYYRMLPAGVAREVLDGILAADRAGFHSWRWADAFLDCCAAVLGATVERNEAGGRVRHRGHVTDVAVHPLGVDAPALRDRAAAGDVRAHLDTLSQAAGGRKLIIRVDRTELSKNIVRGLAAYRELLATRPQWHGRVVHLAFAYPSRSALPEYRAYTERVRQLAAEITAEFGTADWNPLILEVKDDYPRSLAACALADVLLVNPIRDGMNLVAQEGPVLSERGCALVLSREAGAAATLGDDALLVNPFDVSETAEALHQALAMTDEERQRRSAALAATAAASPPGRWLGDQLAALQP